MKTENNKLIQEEEIQDLLYSISEAEFAITDYKAQLKALGYKEPLSEDKTAEQMNPAEFAITQMISYLKNGELFEGERILLYQCERALEYASQFKSKDNIPSLVKLRAAHAAGFNQIDFNEWHRKFNAMYPETDLKDNIPESDSQKEKEAFEAGKSLGWCKIIKTYEEWKAEQ